MLEALEYNTIMELPAVSLARFAANLYRVSFYWRPLPTLIHKYARIYLSPCFILGCWCITVSSWQQNYLSWSEEWQCSGMEVSRSPGSHSSVWNHQRPSEALRLWNQSVCCYAGGKRSGGNPRIYGPWNVEISRKGGTHTMCNSIIIYTQSI